MTELFRVRGPPAQERGLGKDHGILAHQTYCEGGHEAHRRVARVNFLERLVLVLERRPKSTEYEESI
jgi:hypothetical protein